MFMAPFAILSGYQKSGIWLLGIGVFALAITYWLHVSHIILFSLLLINLAVFLALYIWTIPVLRRLPQASYTAIDGVTTIQDGVAVCQRTGLKGWDLVTYAQTLTAQKFTYCRCNPWDSPSRAFARGLGYCQQQALALKAIYDQLGIQVKIVYATRCRFSLKEGLDTSQPIRIPYPGWLKAWFGGEENVLGHCWLRVIVGLEELDVCPGDINNKPGKIHFEILSPVRILYPFIRPFSHLGSAILNVILDNLSLGLAKRQIVN